MAITVNFYTLAKRANSTKRPTGAPSASYSCVLKDGCSILAPVIKLAGIGSDPHALNYAYIAAWSRYYYITDWTWERGEWTASLSCDELATWKTDIGASSLYVLRSAAAYDGNIKDTMYPIKTNIISNGYAASADAAWWSLPSDFTDVGNSGTYGYFVLGIKSYADSGSPVSMGGINYVALNPGQMSTFLHDAYGGAGAEISDVADIYNAINLDNLTQTQQKAILYTAVTPALDYLVSVTWMPTVDALAANAGTILYLGNIGIHCGFYRFSPTQFITKTAKITLPRHPLAATRGDYLNGEPFAHMSIYLPRLGFVDLPADILTDVSEIQVVLEVDPITGLGRYRLGRPDGNGSYFTFAEHSGPIGVSVQLSDNDRSPGDVTNAVSGALSSMVGGISSLARGDVAGAAQAAIGGYNAAVQSSMHIRYPEMRTLGDKGGFLGAETPRPFIYYEFYGVVNEDNNTNGRPLCQVRLLSSLSGYQKILDGDVPIDGMTGEQETVRGYLEGGFYYE